MCGEEVEQYINGVIKYIPITNSKRTGLMTETIEKYKPHKTQQKQ